jgi:acetolactate synthase regulatory subunit
MPKKWNFYVKVLIVEEEEGDVNPDRVTREITRQLQKIYGVRNAEVTNVTTD